MFGQRATFAALTLAVLIPLASPAPAPAQQAAPGDPATLTRADEETLSAGDAALERQDFVAARRQYDQVLQRRDDHPVALERIALSYLLEGRPDECIPFAERSASVRSSFMAHAMMTLGSCLMYVRQDAEALNAFNQAIQEAGEDPELQAYAYGRKATVHYSLLQDVDEARRALVAGIEAWPLFAPNHRMLAELLETHGRTLQAPFLANSFYLLLEPAGPDAREIVESMRPWIVTVEGSGGVYLEPIPGLALLALPSVERRHLLTAYLVEFATLSDPEQRDDLFDTDFPFAGLYQPFFSDLDRAGHTATFAHLAWQESDIEGIWEWLEANLQAVDEFFEWAEEWPGWDDLVAVPADPGREPAAP